MKTLLTITLLSMLCSDADSCGNRDDLGEYRCDHHAIRAWVTTCVQRGHLGSDCRETASDMFCDIVSCQKKPDGTWERRSEEGKTWIWNSGRRGWELVQ